MDIQGVDIAVSKFFAFFMDFSIILHKNIIKDIISYLEEKNLKMGLNLNVKQNGKNCLIPSFIYFLKF